MILRRAAPLLALVAAGCGGGGATPAASDREGGFPAVPATLQRPAEYAWGDAVAERDNRLAAHVAGALGPRFGKAREEHYVTRATALPGLRGDFARRLLKEWRPLPLSWSPGENGFVFSADERAFVVAWLDPQPDGRVPVTIFRFGERPSRH